MQRIKYGIFSSICALALTTNAYALQITEEGTDTIINTSSNSKVEKVETLNVNTNKVEVAPSTQATTTSKTVEEQAPSTTETKPANKALPNSGFVYVSDSTYIWSRRGPGKQYRISGTIPVGTKLQLLQKANGYVEVVNPKGQAVWILADEVQAEESFRSRVPALEEENAKLKFMLDNIDSETVRELKKTSTELKTLKTTHQELLNKSNEQEAKLKELTAANADLESKLETKDQDMQLRWWKQGGLIALIGAIIGVILVYLPRPKHGRRDDYYY